MISIYALETAASTAATAADGPATTAIAGVEMLGMLLPLVLMFVVF